MNTELYKLLVNMSPAELAKIRGKRQDTSTRDQVSLLKKVTEIEQILQKLGLEISLQKSSK